ncbi:LLM class flavin-dependent oxidoreductase [Nocardia farcinica]|uniref:Limonene 1,2-monooxygenase n=2 Tax=Nocardia farcinica TaxID=37329 RepID=A0A0H5NKX6_NOCFR|nr:MULTISPECIES: LLM class flavin-dependent oxidoreductase [Nocardia]AXK85077.1 LLM class flavin-dependent oxidoreductase [Nocardia farcinica]MBA4855486.1 LLM class flavin-dependent oxidoreductase [Nocardia farcinica]MBC9818175.1 LLM class flavin-dependent oxidoreductase [Nocardia farcinica]MBF6067777.1 LLM class flavin-dependent oxidoreductase [Nocardia farcinica]MBF6140844.1 LLM class flavin-dependent oxidoreductase [Nocardia farcinica]
MIDVPLSVLDLAPVQEGADPGAALAATTELARRTEELGYRRFWVAEHHNMPGIASSAPAVLIAHVAAATSRIRVGSGGVMLPNHAPLVVAEQFGTLHALHPGRIDLGIGRAPGTDQATARALRRTEAGLSAENFPQELADLLRYFRGTGPGGIAATPGRGEEPEIWLLGSSGYSAQVAAVLGLRFAFAHHINPAATEAALALYRTEFRPSAQLEAPYAMVAAAALCADTDERAEELARPRDLAFLQLAAGRPRELPTPEQAAAFQPSEGERQFIEQRRAGQALGSPETVHAQLTDLLHRTEADELMINTLVYDIDDRTRSFELIRKLAQG